MTEPDPDRRVHPAFPLIVGLLLGAACGFAGATQFRAPAEAGATNTVYVTSTVTAQAPAPIAPVTTPPPVAGPGGYKLGQTVAVTGAKVTVYAYRSPVATGAPRPDEAGHIWAAIDVKVCVTELSTLSSTPWTLVYANASQVTASSVGYRGFPTPEYEWGEKQFQPGRCLRGWITYSVPKSPKPTMVEYALASGETVDWKV